MTFLQKLFLSMGRRQLLGAALRLALALNLLLPSVAAATSRQDRAENHPHVSAQILGASRSVTQEGPEAPSLVLGTPVEREIAGGETHAYRITLAAGEFTRVVMNQRGIDLGLRVVAPGGQTREVNNVSHTLRAETISLLADAQAAYRLEVTTIKKDSPRGSYEIRIEGQRPASAQDRSRVAAELIAAEAKRLREQNTKEARRAAIEKYGEALPLWRRAGDTQGEAETLLNLGKLHNFLGENDTALEYHSQALPLFRAAGDRWYEAQALNEAGVIYRLKGDLQKALDNYRQSLRLLREIGDRLHEGYMLHNIGVIHFSLGEYEKAIEYYEQSLAVKEAEGDRQGMIPTLNSLGTTNSYLGETSKELEFRRQALLLSRETKDRLSEAYALQNIGATYRDLGEIQKALEHLQQALPIFQGVGNALGEAQVLHNIGVTYYTLNDPEKALDYYNRSLTIRRATKDIAREATTLQNIAAVYMNTGEMGKAIEPLNRALELKRASKDRFGEAQTLRTLGQYYLQSGDGLKALENLRQSLLISQAIKDRGGEASTLHLLGLLEERSGEAAKALDYYRQGLAINRIIKTPKGEPEALHAIARIEMSAGNLPEARARIEDALRIIESQRSKVVSPELRTSFLASKQDYYSLYVELLMRLHEARPAEGFDALALQAAERARARSLLDILSEAGVNIRQGVDATLLERERTLHQQINAKEGYRLRLLGGKHTPEQAAAAERDLQTLITSLQETQAQIRARSPRYAALTQPAPLSLKEIQRQVVDRDTLLLEYALGERRSHLFVVSPTSLAVFELPPRAEIEAASRRLYETLTAKEASLPNETPEQRRLRTSRSRETYVEAASELGQMLLGPAANGLQAKRLLIVTEGALQYVPFAALPVRAKAAGAAGVAPLIAGHEIVALPSASVLTALRRGAGVGGRRADKSIAVFADPVFEDEDPRVRQRLARPAHSNGAGPRTASEPVPASYISVERAAGEAGLSAFERLRFSRQEAETIAAFSAEGSRLKALDFAASREAALNADLSKYSVLHFATHTLLNSRRPELSGIVLSLVDEEGRPRDGFLRLHEIYNLNLKADLVVLSSCQTALGKEVRGEGLVGLARGFMYAGAPRVVGSLWRVDDRATAELMRRFYQRMLGEGLRPAAALREAQISMWKEKRWESPRYWAGFVLQGEW